MRDNPKNKTVTFKIIKADLSNHKKSASERKRSVKPPIQMHLINWSKKGEA